MTLAILAIFFYSSLISSLRTHRYLSRHPEAGKKTRYFMWGVVVVLHLAFLFFMLPLLLGS